MGIDLERLFVPCIVCGEEVRFLDTYSCEQCEEPICPECVRIDRSLIFCSDECYDQFHEDDADLWD